MSSRRRGRGLGLFSGRDGCSVCERKSSDNSIDPDGKILAVWLDKLWLDPQMYVCVIYTYMNEQPPIGVVMASQDAKINQLKDTYAFHVSPTTMFLLCYIYLAGWIFTSLDMDFCLHQAISRQIWQRTKTAG